MQNAHERFGTLEFTKRVKDTITHLVSMVGGDVEIGALRAAVTEGASFHVQLPGRTRIAASRAGVGSVVYAGAQSAKSGCSPVLVSGNKPTFLKWIGKALQEGLIQIPKENGSITWKLPRNFLERSTLEAPRGVRAAT